MVRDSLHSLNMKIGAVSCLQQKSEFSYSTLLGQSLSHRLTFLEEQILASVTATKDESAGGRVNLNEYDLSKRDGSRP